MSRDPLPRLVQAGLVGHPLQLTRNGFADFDTHLQMLFLHVKLMQLLALELFLEHHRAARGSRRAISSSGFWGACIWPWGCPCWPERRQRLWWGALRGELAQALPAWHGLRRAGGWPGITCCCVMGAPPAYHQGRQRGRGSRVRSR